MCSIRPAISLALCIGFLLPTTARPQDPGLERAREIVAGRCFLCHGTHGESASELFPRLAGQHPRYVAKQLEDFQSGRRKSSTMNEMAKALTSAEMADLGRFFGLQKSDPHPSADPDLAAVGRYLYTKGNVFSGVPACGTCHGPAGAGTEGLPRLAGQHARYTENQLKQFNARERTNDNAVMHSVASKLSELEVKALSEYLSSQP